MRRLPVFLLLLLAAPLAGQPASPTPAERAAQARAHANARALLRAGRFQEAVVTLTAVARGRAGRVTAWYDLGYAYRRLKRYPEAVQAYTAYARRRPDDPGAHFGLGLSYHESGNRAAALEALRRYVALERRPTEARWVQQARALIARLEGGGASAAALKAQGDQARARGDLKTAVTHYRAATQADPRSVPAWNDLGNALFAAGRLAEAEQAFRGALKVDEGYAVAWYNLAHVLRRQGRSADAVTAYLRCTRLQPTHPDPFYGLGQAYKDVGNPAGAMWAFTRYVALEQRPGEARYVAGARALVAAYRRRGIRPAAPPTGGGTGAPAPPARPAPAPPARPAPAPPARPAPAAAATSGRPPAPARPAGQPSTALAAGDSARASGDLARATLAYRGAVALDAGNLEARRRLAQTLAESDRLREAVAQWRLVKWRAPTDRKVAQALAETEARLAKGEHPTRATAASIREALAARKLAFAGADAATLVAAHPRDPDAVAVRGEVHLATGDARAALADFQQALRLGFSRPAILFHLGQAYQRLGSRRQAVDHYRRYLEKAKGNRRERFRVATAQQALTELSK